MTNKKTVTYISINPMILISVKYLAVIWCIYYKIWRAIQFLLMQYPSYFVLKNLNDAIHQKERFGGVCIPPPLFYEFTPSSPLTIEKCVVQYLRSNQSFRQKNTCHNIYIFELYNFLAKLTKFRSISQFPKFLKICNLNENNYKYRNIFLHPF